MPRGWWFGFALVALAASAQAAIWDDETSGLCAASEVRRGVFIYTDYVYDDRGADTNGVAGGDFTYPSGASYKSNAADLIELRVMPDVAAGTITFGARLNTVVDPALPVVAIGIDTGGGTDAAWPFGVGVHAPVTHVLTIRADQAVLTTIAPAPDASVPVTVGNDTPPGERQLENTFTTTVDITALGLASVPQSGSWKLYAVSGLWENGSWKRPGGAAVPAPYDLAFVAGEDFTNWQQNRQASILASGDLATAAGVLDFATFPDFTPAVATGRQTRIYRSAREASFGEGIEPWLLRPIDGLENEVAVPVMNNYLGLFEPYAVWVPADYEARKPIPLFFTMHGAAGTHLGLGEWQNGKIDVPAMAFSPLGRGELNFYIAEGELDILEAFADLKRHYAIDEDRVYVSGTSMGGFETYKLAVRHPDLFAAAVPLIGTSDSEEGLYPSPLDQIQSERLLSNRMASGSREMLENVLDLPFRIFNGQIDYLVNNSFVLGDVLRFEELAYDYQYNAFTRRTHETVPEITNLLYHQVLDGCSPPFLGCDPNLDPGRKVREPNPAHVVYKTYPFQFFPDLGLEYRGAYWVSGLEVRDASHDSSFGMIDARSRALAAGCRDAATRLGPEVRFYAPTTDPYLFLGLRRTATPGAASNGLEATLRNLSAATLDLARMAIDDTSFSADVAGDGMAKLTFLGSFSGSDSVTVLRNGAPFTEFSVTDGALVLDTAFGAVSHFEVSH